MSMNDAYPPGTTHDAVQAWMDGPCPPAQDDRWVLIDGAGDLAAVGMTREEIKAREIDLDMYLDEASACGHPDAPAWAAKRWNGRVVEHMTREELWRAFDEDYGYLDREP